MIERPEGVQAKVDWAYHHLKLVRAETDRYLRRHPHFIEAQLNFHIPGYDLYLRTRRPPVRLALLVGDFTQNLRNSLDHLARGLVLTTGGTPVDRGRGATKFPIWHDPPPSSWHPIAGLCQGHADYAKIVERLRSLQPKMAGDITDLIVLSELSNADKHRTLQFPTGASLASGGGNANAFVVQVGGASLVRVGTARTGEKIGELPVPNPVPNPKVRQHGQFTTLIYMPQVGHVTNPQPRLLLDGLQQLQDFVVTKTLPLFSDFFA